MMKTLYGATAKRRNLSGKPDYIWIATYANGQTMQFTTEEKAMEYAKSNVDTHAHSMYEPSTFVIQIK